MGSIKSYRDLEIWQLGIEIVKDVYSMTAAFPKDEIFGLSGQMKRAAVSLPSNIAEGFRRLHSKEYRQFLHVSMASCAELETQVTISRMIGFIPDKAEEEMLSKLERFCRMTMSLSKKLNT
jgi:four helix bundle protein